MDRFFTVAFITDKGKVRDHNEDSLLVDKEHGFFLLADGLGGHQAGEVASDLAVRTAYAYLKANQEKITGHDVREDNLPDIIKDAIFEAHNAVLEQSKTAPHLEGMGTTLTVMVLRNTTACIGHVGDSRAYLIRDRITQITRDHTLGRPTAARLSITMPLAPRKVSGFPENPPPRSHILTQAVGVPDDLAPETFRLKLQTNDRILLCTDGLTDMLPDSEIASILATLPHRAGADLRPAVAALAEAANNKGGIDNISIILVSIRSSPKNFATDKTTH